MTAIVTNYLPFDEYLALPGLSQSIIKHGLKSPLHMAAAIAEPPKEPTPDMVLGSAVHCATLEPEKFASQYAQVPDVDRRTKVGKEAYAQWATENSGKTALTPEQWDTALTMAEQIATHPTAGTILEATHPDNRELSVQWDRSFMDSDGAMIPVQLKARFDGLIPAQRIVWDIKTTNDASTEGFQRTMATYHYNMQGAHYLDGVRAAFNASGQWDFTFVVIEKTQPFAVHVFERLSPPALVQGLEERDMVLRQWVRYRHEETIPGYQDTREIDLPRWAQRDREI